MFKASLTSRTGTSLSVTIQHFAGFGHQVAVMSIWLSAQIRALFTLTAVTFRRVLLLLHIELLSTVEATSIILHIIALIAPCSHMLNENKRRDKIYTDTIHDKTDQMHLLLQMRSRY